MTLTTANRYVISGTTNRSDGDWGGERLAAQQDELRRILRRRHGGIATRVIWAKQVHGAAVIPIGGAAGSGVVGEADALITDRPDTLLTVRTADCVPVFLESPDAVGIVHAGLAGAAKGVFPEAVRQMQERYGIRPDDLSVRFGPHICNSCYAMSERNLAFLAEYPAAARFAIERGDRRFLSLIDLLAEQATEAGIRRLEADPRCTYHDPELFSSRRGHDHRQISFVMLTRPRVPATVHA